jgi:hypothetical protein
MNAQLNGRVLWSRYFLAAALAIVLLQVSFQPAFGATNPANAIVITDGKEQFMSTLASMPYTSSGTGPVLYLLECSTCPFSQAFEKDWKDKLGGVEVRRLLIAINPQTMRETAYLARTRDINDFYAFMNQTKLAPEIKADDKKTILAFNSVVEPLKNVLLPTMVKNGWLTTGPPPQFMWETNGRVYVSGGYSKKLVQDVLSVLRSGTQTKEANVAPLRPPASDLGSSRDGSSTAETTGQVKSAENKNPAPAGDTPASDSGSKSGGSGGLGPDVLGLRIGTTPPEARAIFKSRILVSDSLRKMYQEYSKTLVFEDSPGQHVPLPNGNYLNSLKTGGSPDGVSMHGLSVAFAPVPGHEGIVSLTRQVVFPEGKKPTVDAFEKTLFEKYGTPTYSDPESRQSYLWSYDSNGTLQKPGFIKDIGYCGSAERWARDNLDQNRDGGDWVFVLSGLGDPKFEQLPARCGAILLHVWTDFDGIRYAGPSTLIKGHYVSMQGYDAAIRALKVAGAIIDKAQAEASAAAIKKGQKQKPDF